ncbi:MAG: rhomboid family intramembrane serine protease [Candidatus Bathyarchaeia archaeon]
MKKTNILIIACVLVSLLYWLTYPSLEDWLVYSGERLTKGAFWTLITSLFVHFDFRHLIGNMVFLYVFGMAFEGEAGGRVTAAAFFVGGVGSLLVSSFYYGSDISMIGASGAIFTLAAAAMLVKPLKLSIFFLFMPLGVVAVLYFLFNVFAVALGFGGNVGYVAHVAGFLIGVPFGIACSKGKWAKNLGIVVFMLLAFGAISLLLQFLFDLL